MTKGREIFAAFYDLGTKEGCVTKVLDEYINFPNAVSCAKICWRARPFRLALEVFGEENAIRPNSTTPSH